MSEITIKPSKLSGKVAAPPSKSVAHRAIICAALACGGKVDNLEFSKDIIATINALKSIGAEIETFKNSVIIKGFHLKDNAILNCYESGSTIRFLIPIVAALGLNATFIGEGRLPERPLDEYKRILSEKGISFTLENNKLPLHISGKLKGGQYHVEGNVSSQYITGFLLAFPLVKEECNIALLSPLESAPYVDITTDVMEKFGVSVNVLCIDKNQAYKASDYTVEGDYSQAAFWLVANALGCKLNIIGLNESSKQGDKEILSIIERFKNEEERIIDASQIPDLVPIISVLASLTKGKTIITKAGRLRLKESDRLLATTEALSAIGADISQTDDGLMINGKEILGGGKAKGFNDHRIVMALAVASVKCKNPVTIEGYECVDKSYPSFFDVFKTLGGEIL